MTFQIQLAGKIIQIESLHEQVYRLCRDYLVEPMADTADIHVNIGPEDIAREKEKSADENKRSRFSNSYLETLAVYRKIATEMTRFDTWLMHGAVLAIEDNAYMITATSGTGKTTTIQMALKYFQDSYVINGDKPLLRFVENEILACGTPWAGKEHMHRNCQVPLKAIFILERGEQNQLQELRFNEAFPVILQQSFKPEGIPEIKKTLDLLTAINQTPIHIYRLSLRHYTTPQDLENPEVFALLDRLTGEIKRK